MQDVKVKEKPPSGRSFNIEGSKFKSDRGVCVVAPDITTAGEVLELYFAELPNINPVVCESAKELNAEVEKVMRAGLVGVPVGVVKPRKQSSTSEQYTRDAIVKAYILINANGICECCNNKGPFLSEKYGLPFLEHHHVKFLSLGGSDTITNSVAVCPNCHRGLHHSTEKYSMAENLMRKVSRLKSE